MSTDNPDTPQTTDWAFEHGRLRYRLDQLRRFIEGALEAIEDEDYYGASLILCNALKDFQ